MEVLDLSEAFGRANRLAGDDPEVRRKLDEIRAYVATEGVPAESLVRMAKFALVMQRWIEEQELVATVVQCWTSMEEFFGVVPCTVMSMMSNAFLPSACETDVMGAIGMYVMQLASGKPSALVDWNNNYGDDADGIHPTDKGVIFHCSNLPKALFDDASGGQACHMDYQAIIAGTVVGRIKRGPFTYCRVSTDDSCGVIRVYVGEGELTADPLETFGGYGVGGWHTSVRIPDFQGLLHHICENGFEHHVAVNLSQTAAAVNEALSKYMGWDVYYH